MANEEKKQQSQANENVSQENNAQENNGEMDSAVNKRDDVPVQDDKNSDANPAARDMMNEGAPPPEEIDSDVSAEELDNSVRIEVEGGSVEDGDAPDSDVDSEAGAEVDPLEALQAELAEAQAKAAEYLDKMQRTAAEYQNSRRRQEKQTADAIERANGQLIKSLLPVLDDFSLAFDNVPEQLRAGDGSQADSNGHAAEQAWINGFRQIHKKLLDTLTEQGLEKMPTEGEFDPNWHEAVASEASETVESGHIVETLRAGYLYKGQVLRPALIRVAA